MGAGSDGVADPQIAGLLAALDGAGWRVTPRVPGDVAWLGDVVGARYPGLPGEFRRFLDTVAACVNPTGTVWFLGADDYAGCSSAAFAWNEFEQQSLAAAGGDAATVQAVDAFWSRHLPFMISVKDGYAFAAISMADNSGAVVVGREPEYENVEVVSASFGQFADAYAAAVAGGAATPLTPFT